MIATETIQLQKDHDFKIAVVSDTHSQPHPKIGEHLGELSPDVILHAGDIGTLNVLDLFEEIAPTIAVRGNIDVRSSQLPDEVQLELVVGEQVKLKIILTHMAVYGPRLRADARRRAQAASAHLVICGHSHVPLIARDGKIGVFNPGSIGPRRYQLPITFGLINIAKGRVTMEHIDCETGRIWLPPAMSA